MTANIVMLDPTGRLSAHVRDRLPIFWEYWKRDERELPVIHSVRTTGELPAEGTPIAVAVVDSAMLIDLRIRKAHPIGEWDVLSSRLCFCRVLVAHADFRESVPSAFLKVRHDLIDIWSQSWARLEWLHEAIFHVPSDFPLLPHNRERSEVAAT